MIVTTVVIKKLTTEWDSLWRPGAVGPTHSPSWTQELKSPGKDDDLSDIIIMVTAHLSQLYSAIVPSLALSSEGLNVTVLWAGAPGNPHPDTEPAKQGGL